MKTAILMTLGLALTSIAALAPNASASATYECAVEYTVCTCYSDDRTCAGTYNPKCSNSYGATRNTMIGVGCDGLVDLGEGRAASNSEDSGDVNCTVEYAVCTCFSNDQSCPGTYNPKCWQSVGALRNLMIGIDCDGIVQLGRTTMSAGSETYCVVDGRDGDVVCACTSNDYGCSGMFNPDCNLTFGATPSTMIGFDCEGLAGAESASVSAGSEDSGDTDCLVEYAVCTCYSDDYSCPGTYNPRCNNSVGVLRNVMIGYGCQGIIQLP
jgi:hypothetical protein